MVKPHSDNNIGDDTALIRHICNDTNHVVYDHNRNCRRISSAAFSATSDDPDYGMSVDLECSLVKAGLPLDAMVPPGFGAVILPAGGVREIPLLVGPDPIPRDNEFGLRENPHHGQVWGVKSSKLRRRLHSLVAGWVLSLTDVEIR